MIFYEVVNFILVCHFCILLKFPYSLGFLHLFHRISFYPSAPLNYFTEEILTMIKRVREKAQKVLNLLKRCSSIILNHSINFFVHFAA